ncbi:MAG: helix-turn-helix transcriptional regulator [Opitutales bacterium]
MTMGNHWSFFTNHAQVLTCIAHKPNQPLREVAATIGITERAVQRIVADLEVGGYLRRKRVGRQNTYEILVDRQLSNPIESHRKIADLVGSID